MPKAPLDLPPDRSATVGEGRAVEVVQLDADAARAVSKTERPALPDIHRHPDANSFRSGSMNPIPFRQRFVRDCRQRVCITDAMFTAERMESWRRQFNR